MFQTIGQMFQTKRLSLNKFLPKILESKNKIVEKSFAIICRTESYAHIRNNNGRTHLCKYGHDVEEDDGYDHVEIQAKQQSIYSLLARAMNADEISWRGRLNPR